MRHERSGANAGGIVPAAPAGIAAPPLPGTTPPDQLPPVKDDTPVLASGGRLKLPPQTLQMDLSVFGGNGADLNTASVSGLPTGPHVDADASLAYDRRKGRATFGLRGRSVVRHDTIETVTPLGQQGDVDFLYANGRQSFHANQSVAYSPYDDFGGLSAPGETPIGEAADSHGDFANRDLSALTANTIVTWNRPISRRYELNANYNLRRTTFSESPEFNLTTQDLGAHLFRRFTRSVSMQFGYTYRTADRTFDQTMKPRNHDIDVGVNYGREVAKGTLFTFSTGSSVTPQDDQLYFNVTGNAGLTRHIGRTWNTFVGVNRSVRLLEGFTEPVISNALLATAGGGLSRRVSLSSTVAYSSGSVGLDSNTSGPYSNFTGGAGLSFALARQASIEAQYFYAGYLYDGNLALAPGLTSSEQRRHGVRVGFTWHGMLVGHLKGQ